MGKVSLQKMQSMTDTAVDSRRAALGLRYGTAEADRAVLAE